jgi:large subunit ribosomal protein L23
MQINDIIFGPVISEKSYQTSQNKKYTLKVAVKANKYQISQALKKIYDVDVIKINTVNMKSQVVKSKTRKGTVAKKISGYKKAIVVLKKDQKITGFEETK